MSGLAQLLPEFVAAETADAGEDSAPLLPAEEALVARAVEARRRELALGRQCARRALARLGATSGPILAGARGEPLWPTGYVGSITHCRGVVAAAVARAHDLVGLGIDAEPAEELEPPLLPKVCTPEECRWGARIGDALPWGKLIFSAKEAVYKCVYPTRGILLDFQDVTLRIEGAGEFFAESSRCEVSGVRGRWAMTRTHVLTAATWAR